MGFLSLFKKKSSSYVKPSEDAKEELYQIRERRNLIKKLQLDIDIEELRQELMNLRQDQQDNPEAMLMQILQPMLTKGLNSNTSSLNISNPTPELVVLSRNQIQEFINKLDKKQKAILLHSTDEQIKQMVSAQIPNISPQSLELCLQVINEQ